jgi:hypothetical protein
MEVSGVREKEKGMSETSARDATRDWSTYRCHLHLGVQPYNGNATNGECAACAVVPLEADVERLKRALGKEA